jgi:Flp pilus assembly protein TadD
VLRDHPSDVEALFHLGVVLTKKGLWAEAVPNLRHAVELDPTRGLAFFYLGEALNHVDDLHGAMAAYQRAAELVPDHPRALYGLGIVFDRLGRPDDAARMYRLSRAVGRR